MIKTFWVNAHSLTYSLFHGTQEKNVQLIVEVSHPLSTPSTYIDVTHTGRIQSRRGVDCCNQRNVSQDLSTLYINLTQINEM